eukprot:jgi/Ulvmu1/9122/UM005_0218.1
MTKAKDNHGTIRCNIPICGGPASGKTSLICQYASRGRDFPKTYKMTVGTELSVVDATGQNEEMDVKLQLLDTGGHPAQQGLVGQGLGTGHDFCCLVYSVSDKSSFAAVRTWHQMLSMRTTRPKKQLKGVLVACKIDLPPSMHQVSQAEGETLASQLGMEFVQASAMRLADARRPFDQLACLISEEYQHEVARISQCMSTT